jgi:hypothetical protein
MFVAEAGHDDGDVESVPDGNGPDDVMQILGQITRFFDSLNNPYCLTCGAKTVQIRQELYKN